ncbi:MAG TPA: FG-GAP-like repeat-containing protein [Planctomycetota bacterium]|nr:FG-GAP-like repeat-containing protein [Planctomycetota bacterium]
MPVALGDTPRRLAAADLDGDGDTDLFVVERIDNDHAELQVLLNDGGQFNPGWSAVDPAHNAESSVVWDADLADTDADGDVDVVYVVPFGTPCQRFNDGQGQFGPLVGVPTYSFKFENELEDLDGDGSADLVYYEPDIFFDLWFGTMKNAGSGTFLWVSSAFVMLTADIESHRRIALGDVTGDGLRDAAFTSLVSGLRLFRGVPPAPGETIPGWYVPQLISTKPCADAVMVDLDGNGHLDLVASVPPLDSVFVWLAGASGELIRPQRFPAGESPDALAAADLDLDGAPDIVVTNPTTGAVHVLAGAGGGSLQAPVRVHVGAGPTDIVAADLDGDGDSDLAVTCASAGHVALLFNATP